MRKIDDDIAQAQTPLGADYGDSRVFEQFVGQVLARCWLPTDPPPGAREQAHPFLLLPEALNEPLVYTRDGKGVLRCLSNVCTHRGMLVACEGGAAKRLRCTYHGRRFGLDGQMEAAPGFEGARDFPRESDHLPEVALGHWGPLHFVSLDPQVSIADWLVPLDERLGWLPLGDFQYDPTASMDYEIAANWRLYLDNYLEGFHIPTVHKGLAKALDVAAYETELFEHGSLQMGVAAPGEPAFDLPAGHPDSGRQIAAWYFHLFPTTMVNAYPWGLSVNHVEPLGPQRTRVRFLEYVWRPDLREAGAGGDLHRVEFEDEAVVEATQVGVRSRLYTRGRYAPKHERAVFHFHGLLQAALG